jgi:hypothetical protein
MSANSDELPTLDVEGADATIDTLCPHGDDPRPDVPDLTFFEDSERDSDAKGVICNADALDSEWIEADRSLFVTVGGEW